MSRKKSPKKPPDPKQPNPAPHWSAPPPGASKTQQWWEKNAVWGNVGIFAALLITVLAVIFDIRWMVWGASPFGAMALWAVFSPTKSQGRFVGFLLGCSMMLGGLCLVRLKIPPSEIVLTEDDKATFTKALSSALAKPEYTIVSCPAADERTCMYATQFIPLFQRAGWKVQGPSVERSQMGRPTSDVIIVNKGPALVDPQDPDHGVWTRVSPWTQPIRTALMMIGIPPITMNDTELPPKKVRVYFGAIPKKK